jgi:tetratricopeptide (TPR) repeat protein
MPRLEQLDAMLRKEPQDLFLQFARAMELAKLGRTDESLAQFDRVIATDPNYCTAYFQKGRALLAAGRVDEARSALREGIRTAESIGDHHARDEMTGLLESF